MALTMLSWRSIAGGSSESASRQPQVAPTTIVTFLLLRPTRRHRRQAIGHRGEGEASQGRHGAQGVNAVRRSRQERRKALAFLFPLFYRVLGALSDFPIPLNAGIFGLLDRRAVDSINALSEGNRYLPGLRAWVGYRTAIVYYDRNDRIGGEGKLSFISRIKYAVDAITSFSYKPLRFSFVLSGLSLFASFVLMITALVSAGPLNPVVYGMTASVFFVGSLVLLSTGIMGEYIGRVYDEVRHRPLSIIAQVYSAGAAHRAQPARPMAVKSNGQNSDLERISPAV